jgi:hypothetical protein
MRLLLTACLSALFGLIAQIVAFGLEVSLSGGAVYLPASEWAVVPTALAVAVEILAIMVMWMYRISPWLLILMRDRFESDRIARAKPEAMDWTTRMIVIAMTVRWLVHMADTGSFVLPPLIPVAFCLWPVLLPKPAQSRPPSSPLTAPACGEPSHRRSRAAPRGAGQRPRAPGLAT